MGHRPKKHDGHVPQEQEEHHLQAQLDQRVFYLKTLYDISRDVLSCVERERILKDFLLMTMGSMGALDGLIMTGQGGMGEPEGFFCIGFSGVDRQVLKSHASHFLREIREAAGEGQTCPKAGGLLAQVLECVLPFPIQPGRHGFLGLGGKLVSKPYTDTEMELLATLLNNLSIALRNAESFEAVQTLNESLRMRNIELQEALRQLQASLRKVEILEGIKASLSKFVPNMVRSLIEKYPAGEALLTHEQDCSVLFLDIEGYTRLCEHLGAVRLAEIVEKCFSVFMDAIYAHGGDINETAGDGLMVLFLHEDEKRNALQAVETALSIRERAFGFHRTSGGPTEALTVNIGINSGKALVGATKFESYTGSRWTYTARGTTTNIAARIGSFARGGKIFLSKVTADRVKDRFHLTPIGRHRLKNVSGRMELYEV